MGRQIERAKVAGGSGSRRAATQRGTIAGRPKSAAATNTPSTPKAAANSGQERSQNTAARAMPTRAARVLPEGEGAGVAGRGSGPDAAFLQGGAPNPHTHPPSQPPRAAGPAGRARGAP